MGYSDNEVPDSWEEQVEVPDSGEAELEESEAEKQIKNAHQTVKDTKAVAKEFDPITAELQRKLELEKKVREADLENAVDLFTFESARSSRGMRTLETKAAVISLENSEPYTKEDFTKYADALMKRLASFPRSKIQEEFVENIVKGLVKTLDQTGVRRIYSWMGNIKGISENASFSGASKSTTGSATAVKKATTVAVGAFPKKYLAGGSRKKEDGLDMTDYGDLPLDEDEL